MNTQYFDKNRVINFTDAVFSIAMTLLVLEISIPAYELISEKGTIKVLVQLIPNFIGLTVSFFVTALYWISHLKLMKYVDKINIQLLWLNLFLLLFVILLPFSTALVVRGNGIVGTFVFYCLNISLLGVVNYFLIRKIFSKHKNKKTRKNIIGKWEKAKALNAIFIWVLAAALAFVFPVISRLIFVLIFIFEIIINKVYRKKMRLIEEI